jgi:hypothetical protein
MTTGYGGRAGAGGRGEATMAQAGPQQYRLSTVSGSYDAEVWLVHKMPNGNEAVQQQSIRFGTAAREFAFPPVQVEGKDGPITLDFTGSLQVLGGPGRGTWALAAARGFRAGQATTVTAQRPQEGASSDATAMFAVSIARRARRGTPFIDTRGATDISIQVPKPGDVFSFELPPLQKATEDLLKGHTFSLRVRFTPVR